jgi:hypothetical protein
MIRLLVMLPLFFFFSCKDVRKDMAADETVEELSKLTPAALTTLRFEPDTLWVSFSDTTKTISGKFYAYNTGDTAFVIKKVKLSCGCTNIKWSKPAIAPQDSATFFINVNPAEIKKTDGFKTITIMGNMQGFYKELFVALNHLK